MKEEIIQKLIEEQEKVIADLNKTIEDRNAAADIDEETTRDADDFAQQEVNKDFVRRFQEQITIGHEDLATLKSYKFRKNDTFSKGALIEVKEFYILVGAAVHNVEHNKKKVVCMSMEAPAYGLNEGKKAGDKMKMGNKETKILSIQ